MPKVLIATDGSDLAIEAAHEALALLAPGSELTVLSVVDLRAELAVGAGGVLGAETMAMPMADPGTAAELDDALTRDASDAVRRTTAALDGAPAKAMVAHGDPAVEICRVAEDGGFDLVVVGSHGSGLVKRILVGSVSHHVVHHAPCPVLVVRRPNEPDG
jgi:nucleotide-binding universal stress UspA family protein